MRIDLILRDRRAYSYEGYTARRIRDVLQCKKVACQTIYLTEGLLQDYIHYLQEQPPLALLSFAELFFAERPFCDIVELPQFFWAQHSLAEAATFIDSTFGTIGLPHPSSLDKTYYLPHGVDRLPAQERRFDTVLFSALVDTEVLRSLWREAFPEELVALVDQAIASGLPPYAAATQVLPKQPAPGTFAFLLYAVETYQKAVWAEATVATFEGERLDIFGKHMGNGWSQRLSGDSRIHLHGVLSYWDQLDVLRQSKRMILDPLEPHWAGNAVAAGCELVGAPAYSILPASWETQVTQLMEVLHAH